MSLVSADRNVAPATLVRSAPDEPCYPGIDRIGQKLARGVGDYLAGLMSTPVTVSVSTIRVEEPEEGNLLTRQVKLTPASGAMEVAIERVSLMALVDLYYGGDGTQDEVRDRLSPAENRFFGRLTEAVCRLLSAAWLPAGSVSPCLEEDAPAIAGARAIQTFVISFPDRAEFELHCRYPLATLEAFAELKSAQPASGDHGLADHDWQARLMGRALDVPFPVRAVFAEPEVPLARLMSLRPGDVIPVCLPTMIELKVADLHFARGSAGESNGRAAICIDHL